MGQLTICDRLYLSEIVYGNIVRSYTPLDTRLLNILNNAVETYAGLHVIITASDEQLEWQYKQRGDDMFPLDTVKKVNAEFLRMVQHPLSTFGLGDAVIHYHEELNSKMPASDDKFLRDLRRQWIARCAWNMANLWK